MRQYIASTLGEEELPPQPRAFLWQNGKLRDLGTLGGAAAIPFALNEAGQIVGQSLTKSGQWHAYVWSEGRMTALATPGGKSSAALAINGRGQVVGWSETKNGVKHAASGR